MNARILNRSSELPKDGWYQIEVTGTWPAGQFEDGRKRRQQIDRKGLESIVNRFTAEKAEAGDSWTGILVDPDHLSHDLSNSTEAMGWLQEVEIRNDDRGTPQLWGRIDLSDIGENAIKNRRYKRFSTEYDPGDCEDLGDGVVRPLRLSGLAFTNRPNNRGGKPISNRGVAGAAPGETPNQEPTTNTMKAIAEQLGLSAEATEADILAAIGKLQTANSTMKKNADEAEADQVMNRFGDRIPEASKAHWRTRLIANRDETVTLMEASFPEGAEEPKKGQSPVFNRDQAKGPAPVESQQNKESAEANKKAAEIRNRAATIQKTEGLPWSQAFDRASAELN